MSELWIWKEGALKKYLICVCNICTFLGWWSKWLDQVLCTTLAREYISHLVYFIIIGQEVRMYVCMQYKGPCTTLAREYISHLVLIIIGQEVCMYICRIRAPVPPWSESTLVILYYNRLGCMYVCMQDQGPCTTLAREYISHLVYFIIIGQEVRMYVCMYAVQRPLCHLGQRVHQSSCTYNNRLGCMYVCM